MSQTSEPLKLLISTEEARQIAYEWATYRRSHWNEIKANSPDDPVSTTIAKVGCVIADAVESIKWATLAQALAADTSTTAISVGSAEQARKIVDSFERNNLNVPDDLRRMAEGR